MESNREGETAESSIRSCKAILDLQTIINEQLQEGIGNSAWIKHNIERIVPILRTLDRQLTLSPAIIHDTVRIYLNGIRERLTINRNIDAFVSAALYAAFRANGNPINVAEVARAIHIPIIEIMKLYRIIQYELFPEMNLSVKGVTTNRYIEKYIPLLNLSAETCKKSIEIFESARNNGMAIAGKDPRGFAGAAIYLAMQVTLDYTNQNKIAEIAMISTYTLRARIREMKSFVRMDMINP
jgi:transcription initiation factor TFIIIB Brf1 subunit/transcription initiation factor TFIIB